MKQSGILLHDAHQWQSFLPLTFTRPVAELRCGAFTFSERWQIFSGRRTGWVTEKYLQKKYPALPASLLLRPTVYPTKKLLAAIENLDQGQSLFTGNQWLATALSSSEELQASINLEELTRKTKRLDFAGDIFSIDKLTDLFTRNQKFTELDFDWLKKNSRTVSIPAGNTIRKEKWIHASRKIKIWNASLNAADGPIILGSECQIMEGTAIRGPFALGEQATIKMNAKLYGGSSIGPGCKAGGEIVNSIMLANSNKAHDGFLGNSLIGEWCNLGADTNNSNLKNDYGEVKLWSYETGKFEKTNLQFCGLVMGDHSKTGINTMFNTGTVVGVFANIFGSGYPRNFIPSFSWGGSNGFTDYKLEKAVETAGRVMKRMKIEFTAADQEILQHIYQLPNR